MIPVTEFQGERVAVFGLGRSGLSAIRALVAGGAEVVAGDDSSDSLAGAARLGADTADLIETDWHDIRALVLSPGVPLTHPEPHPVVRSAKAAGIEIFCDVPLMAAAVRACGPRIVGITGTNGKSTTTALLGHLLHHAGRPVQVGGNIGAPALDLEPLADDGTYVIEMSSYQLDLARGMVFDVAALLNLSPDHLDRHGGMDGYVAAKRHIFDGQGPACSAVIAVDDQLTAAIFDDLASHGAQRLIPVSTRGPVEGGIFVTDGALHDALDGDARRIASLTGIDSLAGGHNRQNAAVAYAIARALGLAPDQAAAGLAGYPGLAHRMEPIATRHGVRYVNDSKATNAMAAAQGLAAFERIHWIAGGRGKDEDLGVLTPHLGHVVRAYLIGEAAQRLAGLAMPATTCGTLDRAVAEAAAAAAPGEVVLLSPACASFDQFTSFEARGERFRDLVEALS
jgi:UDP-N-acetylmuramoylalanine--D-glutamate ligase